MMTVTNATPLIMALVITPSFICPGTDCAEQARFKLQGPNPFGDKIYGACFYHKFENLIEFRRLSWSRDREKRTSTESNRVSFTADCGFGDTLVVPRKDWPWGRKPMYVRMMYGRGSSAIGLDSFMPISPRYMGKSYIVNTGFGSPDQIAFVFLMNPSLKTTIEVALLKGPTMRPLLDSLEGIRVDNGRLQKTLAVRVAPQSTKFLHSISAMVALKLSSTAVFGVLAGSMTPRDILKNGATHMVEMFPPICFFSNSEVYVIPFNAGHFLTTNIQIVGLGKASWISSFNLGKSSEKPWRFIIPQNGSHQMYTQQYSNLVTSSEKIMVMQVHRPNNYEYPTAMNLVPPMSQWVNTAILVPLSDGNPDIDHFAYIAIKTEHRSNFYARSIGSRRPKPSSSLVTFHGMGDYSIGILHLQRSDIIRLINLNDKFLVIQYGKEKGQKGRIVYASPVLMYFEGCPRNEFVTTTKPAPNPSDAHRDGSDAVYIPGQKSNRTDEKDDNDSDGGAGNGHNGNDNDSDGGAGNGHNGNDNGDAVYRIVFSILGTLLLLGGLLSAILIYRRREQRKVQEDNVDNDASEAENDEQEDETEIKSETETEYSYSEGTSVDA